MIVHKSGEILMFKSPGEWNTGHYNSSRCDLPSRMDLSSSELHSRSDFLWDVHKTIE